MEIEFTTQVFKEGRTYVAYTPELDVSSCGRTEDKARLNLIEAVRLFLEEAGNMGTIDQILEEAGYVKRRGSIEAPKLISVERAKIHCRWRMPRLSPAGLSRDEYLKLLEQ